MDRVYTLQEFEDEPSLKTPISAANLNKIDSALYQIDGRVIEMDVSKANQSDMLSVIKNVTYNIDTGVFTFTWVNGTELIVDLNVEKIPIDFKMDQNGVITMTNADGTKYTCDISSLIKNYEFIDSDTIKYTITTDNNGNKSIKAEVKNGSITAEKLQPNYLADIQTQVSTANTLAAQTLTSANNAATSEANANKANEEAGASAAAALQSANNVEAYKNAAVDASNAAKTSETNAKNSENAAKASENIAVSAANTALESSNIITESANRAEASAISAEASAEEAKKQALPIPKMTKEHYLAHLSEYAGRVVDITDENLKAYDIGYESLVNGRNTNVGSALDEIFDGGIGGNDIVDITQAKYNEMSEEERKTSEHIYRVTDAPSKKLDATNVSYTDSDGIKTNVKEELDTLNINLDGLIFKKVSELPSDASAHTDTVYFVTGA